MNPRCDYSTYCHYYEIREKKPTLEILQEQIRDIDNQIEQAKQMSISEPVRMCVIYELEEKKADIVKAMHKCIDEMYN